MKIDTLSSVRQMREIILSLNFILINYDTAKMFPDRQFGKPKRSGAAFMAYGRIFAPDYKVVL